MRGKEVNAERELHQAVQGTLIVELTERAMPRLDLGVDPELTGECPLVFTELPGQGGLVAGQIVQQHVELRVGVFTAAIRICASVSTPALGQHDEPDDHSN